MQFFENWELICCGLLKPDEKNFGSI